MLLLPLKSFLLNVHVVRKLSMSKTALDVQIYIFVELTGSFYQQPISWWLAVMLHVFSNNQLWLANPTCD